MDTLIKALLTDCGGVPLAVWVLGALVILSIVGSRMTIRIRRTTKKAEFLLETAPGERTKGKSVSEVKQIEED